MTRFSETLMEHFQYPVNRFCMHSPDLVGLGSLEGHAPFVTLYLQIDEDRVARASFEAEGCGVTIACASMLTAKITGRTLAECRLFTVEELARALDGPPPDKAYCAHVAVLALRDALCKVVGQELQVGDD